MTKQERLATVLDSYHPTNLQQFLQSADSIEDVYRKHFPDDVSINDLINGMRERVQAYVPEPGAKVDAGVIEGMNGSQGGPAKK